MTPPLYRVEFDARAWDDIMALSDKIQLRVFNATDALEAEPRPRGALKLQGREEYRVRVGDLRILYTIEDAVLRVVVVEVGNRREIYKKR